MQQCKACVSGELVSSQSSWTLSLCKKMATYTPEGDVVSGAMVRLHFPSIAAPFHQAYDTDKTQSAAGVKIRLAPYLTASPEPLLRNDADVVSHQDLSS